MSPTAADFLRSALALSADGRLSLADALAEATSGYSPMSLPVWMADDYLHAAAEVLDLDAADHLDADERARVVARALALAGAR